MRYTPLATDALCPMPARAPHVTEKGYIIQFFDPSFNSQQSTVNNNSGATGIDMTPGEGGLTNIFDANDIGQPAPRPKAYSASSKCSATAW